MVDAYYFCVGGAVGKHQHTARPVGYRAPATEVPDAIERLLRAYLGERKNGDTFRAFTARHTDEELRGLLAGQAGAAGVGDASPGRPPRGAGETPPRGGLCPDSLRGARVQVME